LYTVTSYVPATASGAMNETLLVVLARTCATRLGPTRTPIPDSRAVPVMVTV